jgi:hypothetical protein
MGWLLFVFQNCFHHHELSMMIKIIFHLFLFVFSELIPSPRAVHDDEDNFPFVDYDEYDAQVFKLPTPSLG